MFFKKVIINAPVDRGIYVVLGGTYSGEYLVYMKQEKDHYLFMSLPDKIKREVPVESFKNGIKYKLLEFIEKLPNKVFNIVAEEYKALNNINGQSRTKENNQPDKRHASGA